MIGVTSRLHIGERMRTAAKHFTTLEWIILFGTTAAAIVVTEFLRLSQKWEDVVVYTVMLFATVILVLRPAWTRVQFWLNLLPIFALHALGSIVLVQSFPLGRFGIPKLVLIPIGMVEGLFVLAFLWKKTARSGGGNAEGHTL